MVDIAETQHAITHPYFWDDTSSLTRSDTYRNEPDKPAAREALTWRIIDRKDASVSAHESHLDSFQLAGPTSLIKNQNRITDEENICQSYERVQHTGCNPSLRLQIIRDSNLCVSASLKQMRGSEIFRQCSLCDISVKGSAAESCSKAKHIQTAGVKNKDWAVTAAVTSSAGDHSSAHSERLNEKKESERERRCKREEERRKRRWRDKELTGWRGGGGVTGPEGLESSERHWAGYTHKWTAPKTHSTCTIVLSSCAHNAAKCSYARSTSPFSSFVWVCGAVSAEQTVEATFASPPDAGRRACRDACCVSPFADLTEYYTQASLKEVMENVTLLRLLRMITKKREKGRSSELWFGLLFSNVQF